jgi:RimJ/RimL family protein N-acetyltransferase
VHPYSRWWMSIDLRTLAGVGDTEVSWFCAGLPDAESVGRRLQRYLRSGSVRPSWRFMALAPSGEVLGRHWWWSAPGAVTPGGLDLVSVEDFPGALELLERSRDELQIQAAICELGLDDEDSAERAPGRGRWGQLLRDGGFSLSLARVRVRTTPGEVSATTRHAVAFRPARECATEALIDLFRAVADGSLDHGMREDLIRYGASDEARRRLAQALKFGGEPDWFSVMVGDDGQPVGYVVPALVDEKAVIAEVGVARAHRGHGYASDLLAHAARLLGATGVEQIVADTDQANSPMRRVFARAGFTESAPYKIYEYARTHE